MILLICGILKSSNSQKQRVQEWLPGDGKRGKQNCPMGTKLELRKMSRFQKSALEPVVNSRDVQILCVYLIVKQDRKGSPDGASGKELA